MMSVLLCPECGSMICENSCAGRHEFPCVDGIVDLLPNLSDKHLLEEAAHFDSVAKAGRMSISPQAYFFKMMVIDYKQVIYEFVEKAMPDYRERASVTIGEIGCGSGYCNGISSTYSIQSSRIFWCGYFHDDNAIRIRKDEKRPHCVAGAFCKSRCCQQAVQQRDNRHHVLCLSIASFQAQTSYRVGFCCLETRRTISAE